MTLRGGFLIAPSGTCFSRLREDERYRRAILAADLAIADSGLMVVLCRLFRRESLQRISGLKYLKHLLATLKGAGRAEVFWIVPTIAPGKNYWIGRGGKRSGLPTRIVTLRRATDSTLPIQLLLR